MDNATLYAVTHKSINIIPERVLIGVGKNRNLTNVSVYDNTGINISKKNANYCELTALFWVWKNDNSDIVGLEHYRRQFVINGSLATKKELVTLLNNYDIIVPKRANLPSSIYHDYVHKHSEEELILTEKYIKNKCPSYLKSFEQMKYENKIRLCNMFVAKKWVINEYCKWLFDILFGIEEFVNLDSRSDYNKRVFGFLSERLFNVYLSSHPELRIYDLNISEPSDSHLQRFSIINEIKYHFKRTINYEGMYR